MTLHLTQLQTPAFSTATAVTGKVELNRDEVHLWLLDINQFTADHYAHAGQIMNNSEHERAGKFIRGKQEYIASRWLLRKVIARYTGLAPEAVEFLRTDKGKPYLEASDLQFSLSHSGHWALLAVGKAEFIGVDIEAIHTIRDLSGIAENYYHPAEFAELRLLQEADQTNYFYRLWTLKEAFLKATGTGISAGMEKIHFEFTGDNISAQIDTSLCCDTGEWHFHQWALTAQDYCALASKNPHPLEVKWFDSLSGPAFP